MKRRLIFGSIIFIFIILTLACSLSPQADTTLENTRVALAVQQTSIVLEQTNIAQAQPPTEIPEVVLQPTYTPYPTYTQPVVESTEVLPPTLLPPTVTLASTATFTATATTTRLIQQITVDRKVFYCISSDGPTTLTITVQVSDINRGMAVWWRLEDKNTQRKTDWQFEDLRRASSNTRSFTFDADVWAGTNNFFYPPLMGESWFLFQIISDDGKERTDVFADVTFFPCAQ
jgi:hypothetical protein